MPDNTVTNYFLKFEGEDIPGESTVKDHEGEIDIDSASWSISNVGSAGRGGGAGVANVSAGDMHFTKKTDKASAILFQDCATNAHHNKATLSITKGTGGDRLLYLKFEMEEVVVTSWLTSGNGGNIPNEQFSLDFAKVTVTYKPQEATGGGGADIIGSYDFAKDSKS
jgi:type VI secretion system secreted protein Hcp